MKHILTYKQELELKGDQRKTIQYGVLNYCNRNLITNNSCVIYHVFPSSEKTPTSPAVPAFTANEAEEEEEEDLIPAQAPSPPAQDMEFHPLEEQMERQLSVVNAFTGNYFDKRYHAIIHVTEWLQVAK